jgi:hypothetical protein
MQRVLVLDRQVHRGRVVVEVAGDALEGVLRGRGVVQRGLHLDGGWV